MPSGTRSTPAAPSPVATAGRRRALVELAAPAQPTASAAGRERTFAEVLPSSKSPSPSPAPVAALRAKRSLGTSSYSVPSAGGARPSAESRTLRRSAAPVPPLAAIPRSAVTSVVGARAAPAVPVGSAALAVPPLSSLPAAPVPPTYTTDAVPPSFASDTGETIVFDNESQTWQGLIQTTARELRRRHAQCYSTQAITHQLKVPKQHDISFFVK